MAQSEVRNWFGDIASHPAEVVEVHSPEDIVADQILALACDVKYFLR